MYGDTPCYNLLPILCINNAGLPRRLFPNWGNAVFTWSGGYVVPTEPIQGCALTSKEVADEFCRERFGNKWEIASFHSGRSPDRFVGVGNALNKPWLKGFAKWERFRRFWIYHEHFTANCWNSSEI